MKPENLHFNKFPGIAAAFCGHVVRPTNIRSLGPRGGIIVIN